MKTRDAVIGFIVLVVLISGAVLIRNARKNKALPLPTPSVEQKVTEKFGGLTIPSDVDKVDLADVSGGTGLGIATRKFANGKFELTVLADLPAPKAGNSYKAVLYKGDSLISVGFLRIAKGGYLVDFTSSKDYSDFSKVVVMMGSTNILEGSF